MRMRLLTPAVLLAALAACDGGGSGGTTGPDGRELSSQERAALSRAIVGTSTGVARGGASLDVSRDGEPGTGSFTVTINQTAPCQPSGSVKVAGQMTGAWNGTAQTAQLQAGFAVAHQACAVHTENGGTVTLTGDPDIDVTLTATANAQGLATLSATQVGAFTWARGDGNSGRCTVDLVAELVPGTEKVNLTGTFCGVSVTGTQLDV